MREAVRKVPKRRRYAAVAILALFVVAATVTSATARNARPHKAAFKAVIKAADGCGYPFSNTTAAPRAATTFNESTVLKGFSSLALGTATGTVQEFYSDEWALNAGTGVGNPGTPTGWNATYHHPVATKHIFADDAGSNPNNIGTGTTRTSMAGMIGGGADPQGRPDPPVIYVTDLGPLSSPAANGPSAGDWQQGDLAAAQTRAQKPSFIAGTWKPDGLQVDLYANSSGQVFTTNVSGSVKQTNGKTGVTPGVWLGPHADAFNTSLNTNAENYAAEARWDTSNLQAYNPNTTA
jgi:hypothetical protein